MQDEFAQLYWAKLMTSLERDRSGGRVFPPASQVFYALELTWCESVKVVILGQDPYATLGRAHGLCFSVPCGVRRPYSLARIHSELGTDVGVPTSPNQASLAPWAHRGVLLLNTTLTVSEGVPGSHVGLGWERFTDKVLEVVARERDPVFLLMGKEAQRKALMEGAPLRGSPNVVMVPHPRHHTFGGSEPFSKVDRRLRKLKRGEMDWSLKP